MSKSGKSISLRIEQGILLKPYQAPYTRKDGGGHVLRQGWTPGRTPEMQAAFDALKVEHDTTPNHIIWSQVEQERGEELAQFKRPYPGWFPVGPKSDKAIARAYRKLFRRMNPDVDKRVRLAGKWSGPKAKRPLDGDYILEGGIMRPVTDETLVNALVADKVIDKIVGKMLRGGTGER